MHESLERDFSLCTTEVKQTTVDAYVARHGCHPDLIKIDTEGNELRVLRGSLETLGSCRPLVIFESRPGERSALFQLFGQLQYRIALLPVQRGCRPQVLTSDSFYGCAANNFIAFGSEQLPHGSLLL